MPAKAYTYALPYELSEKYDIRRYGFHGTSHRYVSHRVADFLGKKYEDLRIITCHLGNGSSFAAVKDGKCQDTSMGLTPLAGICMGTRTGDIDPAIVPFLMKNERYTPDEMDNLLNKKSGVQGVSGVSSDFRDLEKAANEGNDRASSLSTCSHTRARRSSVLMLLQWAVLTLSYSLQVSARTQTT